MIRLACFSLIVFLLVHCGPSRPAASLILFNGTIYTMNEAAPLAEAVVVNGDRIAYVGSRAEALKWKGPDTEMFDLAGQTMTPGLIEGHGHFLGLGQSLMTLDLRDTRSFEEIAEKVAAAVKRAQPGQWITGRGWHQSKWDALPPKMIGGFPTHDALSAVSPENPVYLRHASGHAGIANAKAMEIAGITSASVFEETGEIVKDESGQPTGLLNEEAESLLKGLGAFTLEMNRRALKRAMETCLANGITSFHDAGVSGATLEMYQAMVDSGALQVRLYVMLDGKDDSLLRAWYARGPLVGDWLTVRAIKLYADGALGSRGALLLAPYEDMPATRGKPDMPPSAVEAVAREGLSHGFQACTHAIGDRANREALDAYEKVIAAQAADAPPPRFRIEHAQHIHPDDIPRFGRLGVIAAMQGIHMASDRPWAIERLGRQRIEDGAYVWQKLLQSGARIVNGTDTPVEPVDPIACFYASVTRQSLAGTPPGGYEGSQKMSREQALRSYTLDAAYGAFEEDKKGSIEAGKLADFTVFTQDIMTVPDETLLQTRIAATLAGGRVVYRP